MTDEDRDIVERRLKRQEQDRLLLRGWLRRAAKYGALWLSGDEHRQAQRILADIEAGTWREAGIPPRMD